MTIKTHETPMLDQLEGRPWPSFVTGLKHLARAAGRFPAYREFHTLRARPSQGSANIRA